MTGTRIAAAIAFAWAGSGQAFAQPPAAVLEEIVVTAEFRTATARELPLSVTVLDEQALRESSVQHFEELIAQVPNLSLSGEGSRARYFQLRGIGELEQYEGAPNPSVGFIIDDIDFSALGSIATTFDMERVEILRGPQGTRYGSNALGGLVYMRSAAPGDEFSANFELTAGKDATRALGAAVGGTASDSFGYRFSVHQYESNGFRRNAWLGRDDTYGRDELTARGKLQFAPGDRVEIDVTGLYIDIDNGYDAWAIDNSFTTQSDRPGRDAQTSTAGSVRVTAGFDGFDLVSISGAASSDIVFSFDADWGNEELWAPFVYDFFAENIRERRTFNQEIRLVSDEGAIADGRGQWLLGAYFLDVDESNDQLMEGIYSDGDFCDPCLLDDRVRSDYDARNAAIFGQLGAALNDRFGFTAGFRWERRAARYRDTAGNAFRPTDNMLGGEVALTWRIDARRSAYARVARGYKAGGFNINFAGIDFDEFDNLSPDQVAYDPETLWNVEVGVKGLWLDGSLTADIGLFHSRWQDQQVKIPMQLRLGDPSSFQFLTQNAERSTHRGLEAAMQWQGHERLGLFATLGLLDTKVHSFPVFPELEGRAQAHAPRYTYSSGAVWRAQDGWFARVEINGRGSFYYDYGHDQRSRAYSLVHLRAGRDFGPWGVTLWARNLLDKNHSVRGFFFGNEPPDFPDRLYTRLGDPRHYGVTLRYQM
jgi:iron complex outermembrane recepter protein